METLTFVCRRITLEQLLKCSFGLNQTEVNILKILFKKDSELEINEIKLDKDRSTIQRSLNNLLNKELIKRRQINLKKGGYYFVYFSMPKDFIKKQLKEHFDNFREKIEQKIDKW